MPARPLRIRVAQPRCRHGRPRRARDRRSWAPARRIAVGEGYLTQTEAARRAGVSKDSIIRARRAGRLAGAQFQEGRWLIPAEALAAAGLAPSEESETLSRHADPAIEDTGQACSVEQARAAARIAALEDVITRQDEELRFLRQLLADAVATRRQP
jgi:hypothetical protein